eukprot:786487-Pelagomonas_calceolata.AAC.1
MAQSGALQPRSKGINASVIHRRPGACGQCSLLSRESAAEGGLPRVLEGIEGAPTGKQGRIQAGTNTIWSCCPVACPAILVSRRPSVNLPSNCCRITQCMELAHTTPTTNIPAKEFLLLSSPPECPVSATNGAQDR